jgi:hypothetical protein
MISSFPFYKLSDETILGTIPGVASLMKQEYYYTREIILENVYPFLAVCLSQKFILKK